MNDQVTETAVVEEPVVTETVIETNEEKEASAPEQNAGTPSQETEDGKEKTTTQEDEKTFTQKELDEIIQKRIRKAERVAEQRALKVYAEKLEEMQQKPVERQPQVDESRPTIAQYGEDVESYIEAVAEWKMRQRDIEAIKNIEAQQQTKIQSKAEKLYAEAEKLPGFDVDTFEASLTPAIASAIINSDIAPKLMAYISSNPEEVERIVNLHPGRQAAEIGKLEVKLQETKQVVKPSKAPDPIKPVGARGSVASTNPEEMDMDTYMKMRAKNGARWASRH